MEKIEENLGKFEENHGTIEENLGKLKKTMEKLKKHETQKKSKTEKKIQKQFCTRGLKAGKRQAWTPIRSLRSHCCGLGVPVGMDRAEKKRWIWPWGSLCLRGWACKTLCGQKTIEQLTKTMEKLKSCHQKFDGRPWNKLKKTCGKFEENHVSIEENLGKLRKTMEKLKKHETQKKIQNWKKKIQKQFCTRGLKGWQTAGLDAHKKPKKPLLWPWGACWHGPRWEETMDLALG